MDLIVDPVWMLEFIRARCVPGWRTVENGSQYVTCARLDSTGVIVIHVIGVLVVLLFATWALRSFTVAPVVGSPEDRGSGDPHAAGRLAVKGVRRSRFAKRTLDGESSRDRGVGVKDDLR